MRFPIHSLSTHSILFALALSLLLTACEAKVRGNSRVSVTLNDQQIEIVTPNKASVQITNGVAEINTENHEMRVEDAQVLLDGNPIASLPDDWKKLELQIQEGVLTVRVDGTTITSERLASP